MVSKYQKIFDIPNVGEAWKPMLKVAIRRGVLGFRPNALVDSGADIVLLNAQHAKKLGYVWNQGKSFPLGGIEGQPKTAYAFETEIEVLGLPNSQRKARIAFINSDGVDVLLGQIGFFEFFDVKFRYEDKEFDVEVRSPISGSILP